MAKIDQFEKFKQGMKAPSLGAALDAPEKSEPVRRAVEPSVQKKQVSHYLRPEVIMNLNILKARVGRSVSDLYEGAIEDLLHKYREYL